MILPSRRKLGAVALIVAGLGAFLVPFLLRSPSTQGTSPTPTTPGGNNNNNNNNSNGNTGSNSNGGQTTTTTSSGNGNGSGNGGSNGKGNRAEAKSHDPSPHGNAYGVIKNKLDTTIALVKAMGTHDPAFHLHHDTDTDNDTTHGPTSIHNPGDHDSSCAAAEEAHDKG